MQVVRPDMWPITMLPILLLLFLIGIGGAILLRYGFTFYKTKNNIASILFVGLGTLMLFFVGYNWFGYNRIYSENEALIIGEFQCLSNNLKLKVLTDKTWVIIGDAEVLCQNGNWEYVMSEDWCYWNIRSENFKCWVQTGSAITISFEEQNLLFERIKSP